MSEAQRVPGKRVLLICDRLGWPVTHFKGRPITNFVRYVLHGRKLRYWWRLDNTGGLYPLDWVNETDATLKPQAFSPNVSGQSNV